MIILIILCLTLLVVILLNSKTIREQQKILMENQSMMSDVLKVTNDFSDFVDKHYNNVVRSTLCKELEIQMIIESAKDTKESFSETLEKIEKVLSEQ